MHAEIAVITTEFLRDFVDHALRGLAGTLKYTLYTYHSFADLPKIYQSIPPHVKGIVTSGSFPAQVIRHSCPDTERIIRPFNNDDAGMYKLFLQLLHTDRQLDIGRVYADVLDIAGIHPARYLLEEYTPDIPGGQGDCFVPLEHIMKVEGVIEKMSLQDLMESEERYTRKHLALWSQGKIDVSITRFSSIMCRLRDAGLNVYFAYPSIAYLQNLCLATVQELVIRELRDNQPASIVVTAQMDKDAEQVDTPRRLARLYDALQRFNTVSRLDYSVQKKYMGFEILVHRKDVESLTDNFTLCSMRDFLAKRLDFTVHVGYGLGRDLYQARINAVDANREASLAPVSASRLITDKDELVAPLAGAAPLVIPRTASAGVKKLAERCGLSSLTIQKVFSVARAAGDNQITSKEMAHRLSVSQRSANRFLSALKSSGLASVVGHKQDTTKGRPELVYRICVEVVE